ncbi:MAG: ADP-ribosylglycohydrolase family protein [Thermomicrobiales bacterium]|nr:ADP-ribosylglycohydrolase family protein [Thermomicrobiales bacterium]
MATPAGNENAFLGALVGMAIGDALGLPVLGQSGNEIGDLQGYLELPDVGEGEPVKGVISDRTEFALCLVESLTTNEGRLDPENINARLSYLSESGSRRWMSETVISSIDEAFEHDGLAPTDKITEAEPSLGVRGIVIGLLHSVRTQNLADMYSDATIAARLTHTDTESADIVAAVAALTDQAARNVDRDPAWSLPSNAGTSAISARVVEIGEIVKNADSFEDAVLTVVRAGGDTASYGAIAGGIAGARFGAAGLPQNLIDDLDARIYLSMAAPWFYRTAMQRAGFAIDLRLIQNEFPEMN